MKSDLLQPFTAYEDKSPPISFMPESHSVEIGDVGNEHSAGATMQDLGDTTEHPGGRFRRMVLASAVGLFLSFSVASAWAQPTNYTLDFSSMTSSGGHTFSASGTVSNGVWWGFANTNNTLSITSPGVRMDPVSFQHIPFNTGFDTDVTVTCKRGGTTVSTHNTSWSTAGGTYTFQTNCTDVDTIVIRNNNGARDIDNFIYAEAVPPAFVCATVPTVTHSPATVCEGSDATLQISGTLNDATNWHVYTGSCGGTQLGTTPGTTYDVTPSSPSTTYYVRGEYPPNCASEPCGSRSVSVTALDNAGYSYSASSYCVNDTDPTPTITGLSGGGFSSSPGGLSLNPGSGAIDLSLSTPNTYNVTYTTTGSCPNSSDQSVTINALDDASFNYSASAYCLDTSDPTPTITGLAGGSFSSTPAGLSLHPTTGAIDVSVSTPGTYTVTYTTTGTCPHSSNVAVTINALDNAAYSYGAGAYCGNASDPTPTITGLAGGGFTSSPSGLDLNPASGAIDVSASTPNTYTVTYTTTGTCPNSSNSSVTINAPDNPSFNYGAAAYCVDTSDPTPTITGLTGGGFTSSPGGLGLHPATGAIDVSVSTPNAYTVTYTTTGACPASANVSVTVNGLDNAAFNYSSSAYCADASDPSPTVTGLPGGQFTSVPAGLGLHPTTGAIDASSSTPNTYTVSYTTTGSCPATSNVAVTVNGLDDASFNYSASSYTVTGSDPTPTIVGLPGGGFSSTDGLSLHSGSGTIDLSASTVGSYSVQYTTTGICPNSSNVDVGIECDPGWAGDHCDICADDYWGSSCTACADTTCSGNGSCNDGLTGDGQCGCINGWTGVACGACADGFWGSDCTACTVDCSGNGMCNDGLTGNGQCGCDAGWGGDSCEYLEIAAGPLTEDIGGDGTSADVIISGGAQVSGDVTITTTGNVSFQTTGSVTGTDGDPADSLTINAGTVTIDGPIDGLAGLTINATSIIINTAIGGTTAVTTVTLNGPVTLGQDITVSGTDPCGITITGTMAVAGTRELDGNNCDIVVAAINQGGGRLTVRTEGTTYLNGEIVGIDGLFLRGTGAIVSAAGRIDIGGADAVTFVAEGPYQLTKDEVITEGGSGVFFKDTVNGAFNLTVTVTDIGGVVEFDGAVGGQTPLASLTVNQEVQVITDTITEGPTGVIKISANVETSGDQRYEASVLVAATLELEATAGKVVVTSGLAGTLDSSLTIDALGTSLSGVWTFGGTGALSSITSGEQVLSDGSLNTSSGAVTIAANQSGEATGEFVGLQVSVFPITTGSGAIWLEGRGGASGGNGLAVLSNVTSTSGDVTLIGETKSGSGTGLMVGTAATVTTGGAASLSVTGTCPADGDANGYQIAGLLKPGGSGEAVEDTISGTENNHLRLDSTKTTGSIVITGDFQMDHWVAVAGAVVDVTISDDMIWVPTNAKSLSTGGVVTITGDVSLAEDFFAVNPSLIKLGGDIIAPSGRSIRLTTLETTADVEIDAGANTEGEPDSIRFEGTVTGSGSIQATGAVTIHGNVTLTDKGFSVTGPTRIENDVIISTGTGAITLQEVSGRVGEEELQSLTLTASGITSLDGNISEIGALTTNGDGATRINTSSIVVGQSIATIHFYDAVVLEQDSNITDYGSGITFHNTVDGGFDLTAAAPGSAGAVRFEGVVGGESLASLSVTSGTAELGTTVTTSGSQSYGAVSLFDSTTLNASTVTFGQDLSAAQNLTIKTTSDFTLTKSLVFSSTAAFDLTCGGDLTVESSGSVTTATGGLTVDVTDGTADLAAGSKLETADGALSVTVAASTTAEAVMALLAGTVRATGTGTVTIEATLDDHTTTKSDALRVTGAISAVDGDIQITGTGTVSTSNEVRGVNFEDAGSVTSTGTGTISVTGSATSSQFTALGIQFKGTSVITSGDANITVDGTAAGNDGSIGIYFNSSANIAAVNSSGSAEVQVTGTGGAGNGIYSSNGFVQGASGPVTITGSGDGAEIRWNRLLTIEKTAGTYTFDGEIYSPSTGITAASGSYAVSIPDGAFFGLLADFQNGGELTLGAASGNPEFDFNGGLSITGPSQVNLGGDVATNDDDVTIGKPVVLIANSSLTATGATLTLDGTVVGGFSLDLDAATSNINGDIGIGTDNALTAFSVAGSTTNLDADITVTDSVSVDSTAVVLEGSSTVTAGSGGVNFDGTIDDDGSGTTASELTVNTPGITAFRGTIGGSEAIERLTTDANETGPTWIGGDITATATGGSLNFGDRVRLLATVSLTGTSGVTFSDTLDSATSGTYGLTLTVSTNTVSFEDDVGEADALLFLTVNGRNATFRNSPTVWTTGVQTYNAGIAAGAAAYTLRAADLEFGGDVLVSHRPTFAPYDTTASVTVEAPTLTFTSSLTLETAPTEFVLDNEDWGHIGGSSNRRIYLNTAGSTGDVFFYATSLPAPVVINGGRELHMADIDNTWTMTGQNAGGVTATEYEHTFDFMLIETGVGGSGRDLLAFDSTGYFDTAFHGGEGADDLAASTQTVFSVTGPGSGTVSVDDGTSFAFTSIEFASGSDSDDTFTFSGLTAAIADGINGEDGADSATWDHTAASDGVTYTVSDSDVSFGSTSQSIESIASVEIDHGDGDDTVELTVSTTTTFDLDGADPTDGDSLTVDGEQHVVTFREDGTGFDFVGAQSVFHTNFSFANVEDVPVDLSVDITAASAESIEPGQTITHTVLFKNITPSNIEAAFLSFEVPANTKIAASHGDWSCTDAGEAGAACAQTLAFAGGQEIELTVPLEVINPVPAAVETITLEVLIGHVTPAEGDPLVDPDTDNNDDDWTTTLIAQPELGITIVDSHDPVTHEEVLTYTVVVTNYGNQGAVNIDVDVTMPQQGEFNLAGSTEGWSCDDDTCSFFREDELVGGEGSFETELAFLMPQYFESHHHELDVTAHVEDDGNNGVDDPQSNNTESENTVIDAEPDMVVTITDGDVRTAVNSSISYTVDIANVGNQDAVNVVATVSVPTYTTLSSIDPTAGWDCSSTLCTNPIGDLDGGATGQFVFTFVTDETIPAGVEYLFIEATLNDDQTNGEEPTTDSNSAEDSTPFDAEPIMDLAKTTTLTHAEPGQDIAYTLTMQNIGDQGATGIVLNETVPVNTTYNALESTVGWECVDGAVAAGTHCTFSLAGMEALKGRTVIFSVTVDDILGAGQSIVHNEALLEDDGLNSFGNETPTTDTAEVDVDLINQPGLLVGLTHTGEDLPMPEDLIPFDVEWANTGAQGFSGVEMEMIVPEGTIFSVLHSDAWVCSDTVAGSTCTFDVGVVPSGDRNTVVFAVIADDDLEPGTEILQEVYIHDDSLSASLELESDTAEETVLLNRTPEIADQPEDRNATEGQEMSWHLPDDVFSDPDEVRGDTLTVSASSDEPAWVDFDEETFIFSGVPTPDDTGNTTTFEITATDERGLTVSFDLDFIVSNVNNAPEIEDNSEVLGTDINEDDIDNEGDLVSDLTEDLITDSDAGASTGIALVYADDTNGIWEFRLADDGDWTALGTLSESDALVIDAGDDERLRFIPNADYFGPAEGRFVAWDGTDGSVSGDVEVVLGETGGDSAFSSGSALLSIEVLSVNDVPSFIAGEDVSVDEDSGAISVSDWAIDMSTGPENESEQSYEFVVTTDNDDLFSDEPALDGNGTLTFATVRNAAGSATVTVVIVDDGGIERGGVDESDGVDFTISVGAVNDGPLFVAPTPSGTIEVNEDTELAFTIAVEDPDGPELILTVDGAPSTAVVDLENGTFTWTPTYLDWGTWEVVLNASDGSLSDERVIEIVVIVVDTNDNGIPDVFETENGLGLDGDDADGDGIPNLVEIGDYRDPADSDDDGEIDAVETDSDNDGVDDEVEAGDDPENPVDSDDDGTPDYQDTDSDDDELLDDEDNCRTVVNVDQADRDGDGEGDLCDNDIDGDGLENEDEKDIGLDPENEDTDGDTIGDGDEVSDASDPEDTDEDDIIDALDPDSDDDGLFDADEAGDDLVDTEPIDTDDDGTPNFRDSDSDDDDVDDVDDNCPLVANTDQIDTDGDGDGDDCDGDSDGDGLSDEEDNCVWVANPDQNDQDDDGEGDDCDDDQDGDGVVNVDDNCPLSDNPNQEDGDIDGLGDECDPLTGTPEPPGCNCSAAAGSGSGGLTWFMAAVIGLVAIRRRRQRSV